MERIDSEYQREGTHNSFTVSQPLKAWDDALAKECLDAKAKRGRTVTRDGHEPARERMHAKMQTEAGRTIYNRRMHIGETSFAIIKNIFEVRRFLLRGLEKVRTEWRWVCTAYNLKKLMAAIAVPRAQGVKMAVSVKG